MMTWEDIKTNLRGITLDADITFNGYPIESITIEYDQKRKQYKITLSDKKVIDK